MKNKERVVKDIIFYRSGLEKKEIEDTFCKNKEANIFLKENPTAFLFGVIFDQSIPAERAWEAPYLLLKRVGHFDIPSFVSGGPAVLREAVKQKPALHRYTYLGNWIYEASVKLLKEYDGDAKNIWAGCITAKELLQRLLSFKGIGQKKANMACIILYRTFNANITNLEDIDVPYDIHIRRVFLRTGLIENDNLKEVISVGKQFSSEYPGNLDNATWEIGRTFCHPQKPECIKCPLINSCEKLIYKDVKSS